MNFAACSKNYYMSRKPLGFKVLTPEVRVWVRGKAGKRCIFNNKKGFLPVSPPNQNGSLKS